MVTMMMSPKPPVSRLGGQDVIVRLETVVDYFLIVLHALIQSNKAMRFIVVVRDQTIHFLPAPLTPA
jgi:hypothetical protein